MIRVTITVKHSDTEAGYDTWQTHQTHEATVLVDEDAPIMAEEHGAPDGSVAATKLFARLLEVARKYEQEEEGDR